MWTRGRGESVVVVPWKDGWVCGGMSVIEVVTWRDEGTWGERMPVVEVISWKDEGSWRDEWTWLEG
jgi:hypothetical protein